MADIAGWFYDPDAEPDFKQIVEKSLWLFTTFTGVGFSFYVKDFLFANQMPGFHDFPLWSRALIAVSLIALLLRYVVGSAVHLNSRYVPKVSQHIEEVVGADRAGHAQVRLRIGETRQVASTSLRLLYGDIVFLVLFGVVAIYITYAPDLTQFMWRSVYFVFGGFAWGAYAALRRPADRAIAQRWIVIDLVQLSITFALIYAPWQGHRVDLAKTAILAFVYAFCLLVDFAVVSRPPR